MIEKRLSRNEHRDPVLTLTLTGVHDVYRFAFGMTYMQVEFCAVGRKALASLRRQLGRERYGWLVDSMHGDGRHFSRRPGESVYDRGYEDGLADARERLDSLRARARALRADPDFTEMCEAGFPELTALLDEAAGLAEVAA